MKTLRLRLIVALAAVVVAITGCTATSPRSTPAETDPTPTADPVFIEWRDSTQDLTDDLLAEALRLAELGDDNAALDRIDEALCAVLDPPGSIADEPAYLEFVASLMERAETVEQSLVFDDELTEAGELVALPPIEIPDDPAEPVELVDPDGLPASEYPLMRNSIVDGFLDAMTSDSEYRRRIATGLERSGPYLPMIRTKF